MRVLSLILVSFFIQTSIAQDKTVVIEEEAMERPVTGFELRQMAREHNIPLTDEEVEILEMGEISDARYITGGILGTYPLGFGIGHAIQGTWSHKGWIFTAGQLVSLAVLIKGFGDCDLSKEVVCEDAESTLALGAIAFGVFKVWEIVDLWAGVPRYRREYRQLKSYILSKERKNKEVSFHWAPIYNPKLQAGGLGLGFTF